MGRGRRPTEVRERARAALKANPGASLTVVAKLAKCSRGTVKQARADLAKEGHKPPPKPAKPLTEGRARAQRFLRDELAHGPKTVSAVEEAATKAHVELHVLEQARADLGIVTSRANTGGAHAVQWSLPG